MNRHMKKPLTSLLFPFLAAGILLYFLIALSHVNNDLSYEEKEQLETALTRSAVACYAAEGAYPSDLAYLQEHYGIQINEQLYTVKYEFIASNLMPDITVLEKEP